MLKKYFKKITLLVFLFLLLFNFYLVQTINASTQIDMQLQLQTAAKPSWGEQVPIGNSSLGGIVAKIIQAFLGLLGIIFLVLIIYAGFLWMTAQGDEEKVKKAKEILQRAVIGLVIIVSAYAITYFVFSNLPGGTGSSSGGGSMPY